MAVEPHKKNSKLKAKIHDLFIHRVIPDNLLPVIKKYGPEILTDRDMEHIRSATLTRGKISGSEELLDYISRYENWFHCLLQALKDPGVKLESLAVHFSNLKAELDAEEEAMNQVFIERRVPQNEFAFGADSGAASGSQKQATEGLEDDCPMEEGSHYQLLFDDGSQPSGAQRRGSHEYAVVESMRASPPGGAGAAAGVPASWPLQNSGQRARQAQEEEPHRHGNVGHGREYDFSKEETESEFRAFPGWHSNISESMVKDKLEPYVQEEGRYILWYWKELKRPAISITYGGGLKNFIVHKKPRKSRPGQVKYYFINKDQYCDHSMTHLVQLHLQRGIRNTEPGCRHQLIPLRQHVSP